MAYGYHNFVANVISVDSYRGKERQKQLVNLPGTLSPFHFVSVYSSEKVLD